METTAARDFGQSPLRAGIDWDDPRRKALLAVLAQRIVAILNPNRVLDIGCGRGLLVQALLDKGVDTHGITRSPSEVKAASGAVAGRISSGSVLDGIEGSWDLIVCLTALEELSAADVEVAISTFSASTNHLLIGLPSERSTDDHVAARNRSSWAASFAERGLYHRLDVDLSMISSSTMLFERGELTQRDVVLRYENHLDALWFDRMAAQRGAQRASETQRPSSSPDSELRHQLLISRDNAIGTEAELGVLRAENTRLHHEIAANHQRLEATQAALTDAAAVRASTTWRVGSAIVGPLAGLRARARRR